MPRFIAATDLSVSQEDAFSYHERPGCLQRLTPPWEKVSVESTDGSIHVGSRVVLRTNLGPVPLRWVAEHTQYCPPDLFADTQVSGPFAKWDHSHRFVAEDSRSSVLVDDIDFRVPLGSLGSLLGGRLVRRKIESMFAYRHRVTRDDLALASKYEVAPLRIAVSGSSGLVGRNFIALATLLGHTCVRIVRHKASSENEIAIWSSKEEAAKLNHVDVVVHLAGKSIADSRWTPSLKTQIRDSRVLKTHELAELMSRCENPPKTLISASAIGIYGSRGDQQLDENADSGDGFLPGVVKDWEASADPARTAGIRVIHPRLGIVLSPHGGALQKSLLPAKLLGGRLGPGSQWWSWIALDDVLGGLFHLIADARISGPVNFVAPNPVRNATFAKELGMALKRPAIFPAPSFLLRTAMGEMADALLLSSCRAVPRVLEDSGYEFRFPTLKPQLNYCLGVDRLESQRPENSPSGTCNETRS